MDFREQTFPAQVKSKPARQDEQLMRKAIHKTIKMVTESIERWRFNSAVAHIRELSNHLNNFQPVDEGDASVKRVGYETLLRLIEPMTPHIAEEVWQQLGNTSILRDEPWPSYDESLVLDEILTIVVQVNGKLRGRIEMARDTTETEAKKLALNLESVQNLIKDKDILKIIVVPNRIVNIVV